jgi:hypothetical protein
VCFGVPILWAHRLAKKGLAGEERGECLVACAAVLVGALGLAQAGYAARAPYREYLSTEHGIDMESGREPALRDDASLHPPRPVDMWFLRACGIFAVLAGCGAVGLAWTRERRRRAFVRLAQVGHVAGYRVRPTESGGVLTHVLQESADYRVGDRHDDVCELDDRGEVGRLLQR